MEKEEKKTAEWVDSISYIHWNTSVEREGKRKALWKRFLCFYRSGITFVNMCLQDGKKYAIML